MRSPEKGPSPKGKYIEKWSMVKLKGFVYTIQLPIFIYEHITVFFSSCSKIHPSSQNQKTNIILRYPQKQKRLCVHSPRRPKTPLGVLKPPRFGGWTADKPWLPRERPPEIRYLEHLFNMLVPTKTPKPKTGGLTGCKQGKGRRGFKNSPM